MATKKARKKSPAKPTVSVEEQLAEALAEKQDRAIPDHANARVPTVGERVSIGSSPNIFSITRVGDKDVDLQLPDTVVERFRVPVDDLRSIDEPKAVSKPSRPALNLEEVRDHIATAQQSSIDQFSGDIAVLKKYLKSRSVPTEAAEELDRLCKDTEERWQAAVAKIVELLEE